MTTSISHHQSSSYSMAQSFYCRLDCVNDFAVISAASVPTGRIQIRLTNSFRNFAEHEAYTTKDKIIYLSVKFLLTVELCATVHKIK